MCDIVGTKKQVLKSNNSCVDFTWSYDSHMTHSSIPALEQGLAVPQEEPVVVIHDIRLLLWCCLPAALAGLASIFVFFVF